MANRQQKGLLTEMRTCSRSVFSGQKAWQMTAMPHSIIAGQRHRKNRVWLSVFYHYGEEIISTKTNGTNDSFPSILFNACCSLCGYFPLLQREVVDSLSHREWNSSHLPAPRDVVTKEGANI